MTARGRMDDFDFFSFEWYPFDEVCGDTPKQVREHPTLLRNLIAQQYRDGLPKDIPLVITEYGFSSFAGRPEVELPGAIVNAETAALFLELGGETSYYYGLEPNWVFQEEEGKACNTSGNLMLFQFYDDHLIRPVAAYYSAYMITHFWVAPGAEEHRVLPATSTLTTADGFPRVTAYALARPDGKVSVLLLNKDPAQALTVQLKATGGDIDGPLTVHQYSSRQYEWQPASTEENGGRPVRNLPPTESRVHGLMHVTLPPYSITVVHAQTD